MSSVGLGIILIGMDSNQPWSIGLDKISSQGHLGILKAKLAKLRTQLLEPVGPTKGPGEGFDVVKYGDARIALIGFPSVGKSTALAQRESSCTYFFLRVIDSKSLELCYQVRAGLQARIPFLLSSWGAICWRLGDWR